MFIDQIQAIGGKSKRKLRDLLPARTAIRIADRLLGFSASVALLQPHWRRAR
jgi:hypothetical protein